MNLVLDFADAHSWAMFLLLLVVLAVPAALGRRTWNRHARRNAVVSEDLKIILGATLSLFGLLMGFLLSIAISGYNTRVAAEEDEAIAIGNAFQRTTLLMTVPHQQRAEALLHDYLNQRIRFFQATDHDERSNIRMQSIHAQTAMWTLISQLAKQNPTPVMVSVLNASNDLYTTQQKTMASWRHQVPGAAWAILILFGVCSNFLMGYNLHGRGSNPALLLVVPFITALALFMISEIDIPGRGLIHVTPHNLEAVQTTLQQGGLSP